MRSPPPSLSHWNSMDTGTESTTSNSRTWSKWGTKSRAQALSLDNPVASLLWISHHCWPDYVNTPEPYSNTKRL
jgi:hypothetical protein